MWVLLHVVFARHAWQQSGSQGIQGLRRDSWRRRLGRLFRANPVQPEFTTVVSAEGGVEDQTSAKASLAFAQAPTHVLEVALT